MFPQFYFSCQEYLATPTEILHLFWKKKQSKFPLSRSVHKCLFNL